MGLVLGVPFMLLNAFGGVVAGIWLAVEGQWWAIGVGLAGLFGASFAISIALMPGLIFVAPAVAAAERGKTGISIVFMALSVVYTLGIFAIWGTLVYFYFISNLGYYLQTPAVIWSYAIATGPIAYMASKERDNPHSQISALIFSISCVIAMFVGYNNRFDWQPIAWVFGLGAAVGVIISMLSAREFYRHNRG